jgi:hypothetical protein
MRKNLPMKPPVAGRPARPSMAIVMHTPSSGRRAPRPATASMWSPKIVSRSRAISTGERRDVHDQVDGEVEERGLDAEARADDDAAEQVAGLGDPTTTASRRLSEVCPSAPTLPTMIVIVASDGEDRAPR